MLVVAHIDVQMDTFFTQIWQPFVGSNFFCNLLIYTAVVFNLYFYLFYLTMSRM